jgi:hypothetical protein
MQSKIVRSARCITNEILVDTWQKTEFRLDVLTT